MNRHIAIMMTVLLAMISSLQARAVEETSDTVFLFKTWDQLFAFEPASMLVNPYIYEQSHFQYFFEINDEKMNAVIEDEYMAAALGDSIWFINAQYLKNCFDGNVNHLVGYIPLFFNDKLAYFCYGGYPYKNPYWKLDPSLSYGGSYEDFVWHYYYIDFEKGKVLKVDHNVLSSLLEDYHDLQMRYEGMKDYKKKEIIEDYFFKFIDRATQDFMRPYIVDLVD